MPKNGFFVDFYSLLLYNTTINIIKKDGYYYAYP